MFSPHMWQHHAAFVWWCFSTCRFPYQDVVDVLEEYLVVDLRVLYVQFLEQSGIRVVPVDYRLSHADRD